MVCQTVIEESHSMKTYMSNKSHMTCIYVLLAAFIGIFVGAMFGFTSWNRSKQILTMAIVAPNYTDALPWQAAYVQMLYALEQIDDIKCLAVHFEMPDRIEPPRERQRTILLRLLESAASCSQDIVVITIGPTRIPQGLRQTLTKAIMGLPNTWRYVLVGENSMALKPSQAKSLLDLIDRLPTVFSEFEWLRFLQSEYGHELSEHIFMDEPVGDQTVLPDFNGPEKYLKLHDHIPWVMFRTGPWQRDKIPQIVRVYLKAFEKMNPHVTQIYLDDDDAESFILQYYPEYMKDYNSLVPGAYRADVLRLCLLLTHGGYYNDIGHLHKCPLGEICNNFANVYLVAEPYPTTCGIYNAFMGAKKEDPLIRSFLKKVMSNVARREYGENELDVTGPQVLGKVFHGMIGLTCKSPTPSGMQSMRDSRTVYLLRNHHNSSLSRNVIVHSENPSKILIETKFPEYQNHAYVSRKTKHYSELWGSNSVYK